MKIKQSTSDKSILLNARSAYHKELRRPSLFDGRTLQSRWLGTSTFSPEELYNILVSIENNKETTVLKQDRRISVVQATIDNVPVVIKKYQLSGWKDKARYRFRVSQAKRFWAAARIMQQAGLPTPSPLGYLEVYENCVPVTSYMINEFLPDAPLLRPWAETHFAEQSEAFRHEFCDQFLEALLSLYNNGIYHRDTKCENILLKNPLDPTTRAFVWIDLECVQCKNPTKHDIIRNLVQINGALGPEISCDDRMYFLEQLAKTYPWATHEKTINKIKAWTAHRLEKEKKYHASFHEST